MFGKLATVALLGASSLSFVAAAPIAQGPTGMPSAAPGPSGSPSASSSSSAVPAPTATSGDNPFSFPLSNGFPKIQNPSQALTDIELLAHGTLPNGNPPPPPGPMGITNLQLIAFKELFEVAFFTELVANITNNVPGYQVQGYSQQELIDIFTAIQAQEELHTLNANGALAKFGAQPVQPCKYEIPVTNLKDAVALASTFNDVVLGTLQNVETRFGQEGDNGFLQGVASVIGQEGEQNGFFRILQGKIPSALPFLTTSTLEFAFSALNQMFIVPGSCPNINTIPLPIFGALTVDTPNIQPVDQTLQFTFTANDTQHQGDFAALSLVYINQQNTPIVEKLQNIHVQGNTVTFDAFFPFTENELNGLTIAAVTHSAGPFANASEVAAATIFGPGLIEIN